MPGSFLDSDVLLYLMSADPDRAAKARELLREQPDISVQVLNEIASVMLGKWRRTLEETVAFLKQVQFLTNIRPLDIATHQLGVALVERHQLGVYDSMIVASALLAGCDTLYSEDMQHGMTIEDRLTILDPFADPSRTSR